MAKLTAAMKEFIEKGRDPTMVFVTTANRKSIPNVSAKGTFIHIVDDETLAYADVYSQKTFENVKENPQVAIGIVNVKTYKGYQFKGKAEIIEAGPLVEAARAQNPQVKTVTRVKLQEIYLMDYGPEAGKQVA